tara:strand:- start:71 stop:565 length:495 start_codon:yes stop_codon:yes gene_type:complete
MGDCELCGAMKVATRNVTMGRAQVQACNRCTEKMGLNEKVAPGLKQARSFQSTSSLNTSKRKKGKDIMSRGEKELASDFNKRVTAARNSKGWDKKELAHRMAEKINVIQNVESGKRPTDSVVRKLEMTLGIELMVERVSDGNRQIFSGDSRGFTLGDFLLGDKD